MQERLIELIHRDSDTLFVVGDDDQGIHGWRGANITNILEFDQRYPNAVTHKLLTKFRSTSTIVEATSSFAGRELGATRLPKQLTADADRNPREFGVLRFPTRPKEAAFVRDRINGLLGSRYEEPDGTVHGLTPADFAILMHSTNMSEKNGANRHTAFVRALETRGIEYVLNAGGQLFERTQPAAVRSALELLRDGSPNRTQVDELFNSEWITAFPCAELSSARKVFAKWGRLIHAPVAPGVPRQRLFPQQLLHDLLEALGVAARGFGDGTMGDLGTFSKILKDFESVYVSVDGRQRFTELLNFLQNVAGEGYETDSQMMARPDAVTVSTIDKAKGLEYPVVFVVDIEADRFPGKKRPYDGWIPASLVQRARSNGSYQTDQPDQVRLFYTAITRAERFLHVTGSD
ncbi:ATP-dependent DNA helicase PcrA [Streptomyces sp. enrichment culture]